MSGLFKNIVKQTIIWFAAGALFALAANALAPVLGTSLIAKLAAEVSPLWLGTMLAGTAAIATAATPLMDSLFGDKKPEEAKTKEHSGPAKQVNVNIQQAPQQAQGQAIVDSKFRQNLEAERALALMTTGRTPGG